MSDLTEDQETMLKDFAVWDRVVSEIGDLAWQHRHKSPKMTTLIEEFAEAVLVARGKHDDPLRLELGQIASICIGMIVRIDAGIDVANINCK